MSSKRAAAKAPKTLYRIKAPSYFGERELGVTLTDSPEKLIGRTVRVSLYQLTDDPAKQFLLVKFRIVKVTGETAETIFYGHEYEREFVRSLVRRGTSRVDGYYTVETLDGYKLRVQCAVFTQSRIRSGKRTAIRHMMEEVIKEAASRLELGQFAQEVVLGKTAADVYNAVKKIMIPRHVGVIKLKILAIPEAKGGGQAQALEV